MAGTQKIKLSSLDGIYVGMYITTDTDPNNIQWCSVISEIDESTKTITLGAASIPKTLYAGESLRLRPWRGAWSFSHRTIYASDGWKRFSINTFVSDYNDYDVLTRGGSFYIDNVTRDTIYIDDVKLGYASEAIVYRDGTEMYRGYLSDFDDVSAVDKAAPNSVSNLNVDVTTDKVNISYSGVSYDNSTTYNYAIKGKARSTGTYSALSSNHSITFNSGIKGYSVLIDQNPKSIPDNVVETTTSNYSIVKPSYEGFYVHVSTVDKQGNVSVPQHYYYAGNPNLSLTPVPLEDYIKVEWIPKDTWQDYVYMIYQKREGQTEFQSIPSKYKDVKVLEVYPYISVLKDWVNSYGKGLITVDSITSESLNSNPSVIWNYDVVVLGFADSNNGKGLEVNAKNELDRYIASKKGVLFGHDSVYVDDFRSNYRELARKYLNMDVIPDGNHWYNGKDDTRYTGQGGTSNILITKKGFLTNYPYKIGDIGTNLTIPYDHTSYQIANGDIWMRFDYNKKGMDDPYNFYLTSWNNVAMIQTGHSISSYNYSGIYATEDEQKLMINTLFYLAQMTSGNNIEDHTGQDVNTPTKPTLTMVNHDINGGKINGEVSSVDIGTSYDYYVKGEGLKNAHEVQSEIKSTKITAGIKGYSVVVDKNLNTIPDDIIESTTTKFTLNTNIEPGVYIHIKAIDNAGNISEVTHLYHVEKPTLVATPNHSENNIDLNWIVQDTWQGYKYMVYQKREGETDFQSIPSKSRNVKVLEIYPLNSFLKGWMDEHGKGEIFVDSIPIESFNANPSIIWDYDVVVFGFADCNNAKDITYEGSLVVEEYLKQGKGVLFGHDTMRNFAFSGFPRLASYLNMTLGSGTGSEAWYYGVMPDGQSKIRLTKKGLLTKHPWDIGEVGTDFVVPYTHTVTQYPEGDIWLKFVDNLDPSMNVKGNFYLTTWNNAAMIQTGHSNGVTTEDERKLIANTLYYLAQVTTDTKIKDYSGQDLNAPNKPAIINVKANIQNSEIEIAYSSADIGTTYEYYVNGIGVKNSHEIKTDITATTITTGIKGYSIVVDENYNTIPDDIIETVSTTYVVNKQITPDFYVHVKAIDNAGNVSYTAHYNFMENPITPDPSVVEPEIDRELPAPDPQKRGYLKIDNIEYPRYLIYRSGAAGTYTDGTKLGLATYNSVLYYGMGYEGEMLPNDSGFRSDSPYIGYWGDIVYNSNYENHSQNLYKDETRYYHGIDMANNFKPGWQDVNLGNMYPNPTNNGGYPEFNGGSQVAMGGQFILRNSKSKYSDTLPSYGNVVLRSDVLSNLDKYRNFTTDKYGDGMIPGQWRYLGFNVDGRPIKSGEFIEDGVPTSKRTPYLWKWIRYPWINPATRDEARTGIYDGMVPIRDDTFRAFEDYWNTKTPSQNLINRMGLTHYTQLKDYFTVLNPKTSHISGVIKGWSTDGKARIFVIPASERLDLMMTNLRVVDENGVTVQNIVQSYDETTGGIRRSSDLNQARFSPGKQYRAYVTMKNLSGLHTVYNPVVNGYLSYNQNTVKQWNSQSHDIYRVMLFGGNIVDSNDGTTNYANFWDKYGNRVLGTNAKPTVPIRMNPRELKTFVFTFDTPNASTLSNLSNNYGVNDENYANPTMKLEFEVNPKHLISDSVYYDGYYNIPTTIDDTNYNNNVISEAFYFQNMSVSDYELVDKTTGKQVGSLEAGNQYSLNIKVNNYSHFPVNSPIHLDYTIVDEFDRVVYEGTDVDTVSNVSPWSYRKTTIDFTAPHNTRKIKIWGKINDNHRIKSENYFIQDDNFYEEFTVVNGLPHDIWIDNDYNSGKGYSVYPQVAKIGQDTNISVLVGASNFFAVNDVEVRLRNETTGQILGTQIIHGLERSKPPRLVLFNIKPDRLGANNYSIEINPYRVITETIYSNNKVSIPIVVETLNSVLCNTINGYSPVTSNNFTIDFVPYAKLQRRDMINTIFEYSHQSTGCQLKLGTTALYCPGHYSYIWSSYNFTEIELNPVSRNFNEQFKITEVLYRSKETKDNAGKNGIRSDGWVNLLQYPDKAKIKTGYGFELKVRTKYNTNLNDNAPTSQSVPFSIANTVDTEYLLNHATFSYKPKVSDIVITDIDTLCSKMPDGTIIPLEKTYDNNNKFDREKVYEFKRSSTGERRYYISKDVKNDQYSISLNTAKTGLGSYEDAKLLDSKEIIIQVIGGYTDDLKTSLL